MPNKAVGTRPIDRRVDQVIIHSIPSHAVLGYIEQVRGAAVTVTEDLGVYVSRRLIALFS
jgi:hypothetical protein